MTDSSGVTLTCEAVLEWRCS